MLRSRIITASVLLPGLIWLVLFASYTGFFIITTATMILAAVEWLKLLKIGKNRVIYIPLITLGIMMAITLISINPTLSNLSDKSGYAYGKQVVIGYRYAGILSIAALYWLIGFVAIIFYSFKATFVNNYITKHPYCWKIFGFISGFMVLFPSWLAINFMKRGDPYYLFIIMVMVIGVDLGGYIFGKCWGKHRLSIVSPKKTWEGVLGGYIVSLLLVLGLIFGRASYAEYLNYHNIRLIIIWVAIGNFFAVTGDLFESLFKRVAGVKDSGKILPGHGGVLDRIDSFCAVMPIFGLLLNLILVCIDFPIFSYK